MDEGQGHMIIRTDKGYKTKTVVQVEDPGAPQEVTEHLRSKRTKLKKQRGSRTCGGLEPASGNIHQVLMISKNNDSKFRVQTQRYAFKHEQK